MPETGAYVFSFRLYGSATGSGAAPFYISALKQTGSTPSDRPADTLLDIAELTLIKPVNLYYNYYTYSINLTASGQAGDLIYFKIAGANGTALSWGLSNGSNGLNYNTLANRTSMIFWKL